MSDIVKRLKSYIETHPFDGSDSECETVLDQLYQAYAESHKSDPPEISAELKELEEYLCALPLEDNNRSPEFPLTSTCAPQSRSSMPEASESSQLWTPVRA